MSQPFSQHQQPNRPPYRPNPGPQTAGTRPVGVAGSAVSQGQAGPPAGSGAALPSQGPPPRPTFPTAGTQLNPSAYAVGPYPGAPPISAGSLPSRPAGYPQPPFGGQPPTTPAGGVIRPTGPQTNTFVPGPPTTGYPVMDRSGSNGTGTSLTPASTAFANGGTPSAARPPSHFPQAPFDITPPSSSVSTTNRARRAYAPVDGSSVSAYPTQPPPTGPAGNAPAGGLAQPAFAPVQPPSFITPAATPQFGSKQTPVANSYGSVGPYSPGFGQTAVSGMSTVTQGVQNMSVENQRPAWNSNMVNLLQRHVNPNDTLGLNYQPTLSSQFSVSQSPNAICPPSYKRCTVNFIPQSPNLIGKSKIPFGLIVTPYRHILPGEEPVPIISSPQIVRCRRCRAYINPWVQFVEQGTRWKCNMCYLTNEVPGFYDWDPETRTQVDRMKRTELTHSVVEYQAPQEYMVRPPQPVVMVFVIDVSFPAVQSGMVAVAAKTILDTLDRIPNTDNRTKVAFITVDSSLHFYNLSANLSEPQMLVVSDLEETFLPLPCDLLVPLAESRSTICKLLTSLSEMYKTTANSQNALPKALLAAFKLIAPIGGKIVVMQSSLPSVGDGSLKSREDPKILGTPKEVVLLQPANGFYKSLAVDCSRSQVSIDIFCTSPQYGDIATLSGCAKFTGGSTYYFPGFNAARPEDAQKFSTELSHFLSRPIGLEAVLRVRASKGIRMASFHGNFFLRSTDLLALPNVSPDNSYAIEMMITDPISTQTACFQTALLHTSSNGERRIRVITLSLPVTPNLADVFSSADQIAISTLMAKKAVEQSLSNNIDFARDNILNTLLALSNSYKSNFTSQGQSSQLLLPENLSLLPLLSLGILKHTAFRTNGIVPSDLRSYALSMMYVYPPELCMTSLHPRFWALHTLEPTPEKAGESLTFPPLLNLSSEKLDRGGIFLLENGQDIYIWLGKGVAPQLCQMLFDKPAYEAVVPGKATLPVLPNEFSQRVLEMIRKIRTLRLLMMTTFPHVWIVKEDGDPNLKMTFLSQLIEDRVDMSHSYVQFLSVIRDKISRGGSF